MAFIDHDSSRKKFCERIDYVFEEETLLVLALTHASAGAISNSNDNERLEFLGDRVLGLVIADQLVRTFPEAKEGVLARRLNALVRKETCADVAREISLGDMLVMDEAEARSGGRDKTAILGNACEALIAALYLDGGLNVATEFITRYWQARFATIEDVGQDPKTALQEWAHKNFGGTPTYEIVSRSGPDHEPVFEIEVRIAELKPSFGSGPSKRIAEQAAAKALLEREDKH